MSETHASLEDLRSELVGIQSQLDLLRGDVENGFRLLAVVKLTECMPAAAAVEKLKEIERLLPD